MAGRTSENARTTLVLARRYLSDMVHNPALLLSCLIPPGLVAAIWFLVSGNIESPETDRLFVSFMFSYAILFEVIIVTSVVVIFAMAEAREKGTLRTLLLAGVRQGQITLARGIAASAVVAVASVASALVVGASAVNTVLIALVAVVGGLPLVIASLAVGLVTHDQMSAMTLDTPFVIVGLLPMFSLMNEGVASLLPYLPSGGLYLLTQLALEGRLLTPEAVPPAVSTLAWTIAAAAALALVIKRQRPKA